MLLKPGRPRGEEKGKAEAAMARGRKKLTKPQSACVGRKLKKIKRESPGKSKKARLGKAVGICKRNPSAR